MGYIKLEKDNEHVKNLIKRLIDEVLSASGDGDAFWYSKYYDVKDIKQFIIDNNLLPKWWVIKEFNKCILVGENQECLFITNDEESFKCRSPLYQVTLEY